MILDSRPKPIHMKFNSANSDQEICRNFLYFPNDLFYYIFIEWTPLHISPHPGGFYYQ